MLKFQAMATSDSFVKFEKVDKSYDGEILVVKDLNVDIPQGEFLTMLGPSGSGKTTLANLIAGIYMPDAGQISYICREGKKYDSRKYQTHIGYVTQDIYLFHGTVRDNILAGRDLESSALWELLKHVGANKFVQEMGGLDAELVEAGRSLSGGQRRRLGIARALASGAEIVILDEITAGLDELNRKSIYELVERIAKDHIIIWIGHEQWRPSCSDEYRFE